MCEQTTRSNFLDNKVVGLTKDVNAAQLYKTDGSFREQSCKHRYRAGFQDILDRKMASLVGNEVMLLFSHSDGLDSFLKVMGYTGDPIKNAAYCTTVAVKVDRVEGQNKVSDINFLRT